MKRLGVLAIYFSVQALGATGVVKNELELTFSTEEVETPAAVMKAIENLSSGGAVAIDFSGITEIINFGWNAWKVIEANKPNLKSKNSYANALPAEAKGPGAVEGFSEIQYKSYRRTATSWYYGTAFDITYTLAHRYNGRYDGRGKYLDVVTIFPHNVNVSWSYNVEMNVDKIAVNNLGTKENPIGSVAMELDIRVASWFKTSQYKNLYEFRGDSAVVRSVE